MSPNGKGPWATYQRKASYHFLTVSASTPSQGHRVIVKIPIIIDSVDEDVFPEAPLSG